MTLTEATYLVYLLRSVNKARSNNKQIYYSLSVLYAFVNWQRNGEVFLNQILFV